MKNHDLVRAQSERCVRTSFIIGEFDFENAGRERLDHGSYLAASQAPLRLVFEKCNDGKRF